MFCAKCGKPLPDGTGVCPHCGAAQPEPVSQAPAAPSVSQPEPVKAPGKRKVGDRLRELFTGPKKWLAIAAAVVLLAGVVTGGVFAVDAIWGHTPTKVADPVYYLGIQTGGMDGPISYYDYQYTFGGTFTQWFDSAYAANCTHQAASDALYSYAKLLQDKYGGEVSVWSWADTGSGSPLELDARFGPCSLLNKYDRWLKVYYYPEEYRWFIYSSNGFHDDVGLLRMVEAEQYHWPADAETLPAVTPTPEAAETPEVSSSALLYTEYPSYWVYFNLADSLLAVDHPEYDSTAVVETYYFPYDSDTQNAMFDAYCQLLEEWDITHSDTISWADGCRTIFIYPRSADGSSDDSSYFTACVTLALLSSGEEGQLRVRTANVDGLLRMASTPSYWEQQGQPTPPSPQPTPALTYGRVSYDTGEVYEGQLLGGVRSGSGTMTWTSGNVYEGQWENDVRSGSGTYTWTSGNVYAGGWKDDKPHGSGIYTWANGNVYKGTWENGLRQGSGTLTTADGRVYEQVYENEVLVSEKQVTASSATATPTPTAKPTATPTATPKPTATPTPTPKPTATPAVSVSGPALQDLQSFSGNKLEVYATNAKYGFEKNNAFISEYLAAVEKCGFTLRDSWGTSSIGYDYVYDYTGPGTVTTFDIDDLSHRHEYENVALHIETICDMQINITFGGGISYTDLGYRTTLTLKDMSGGSGSSGSGSGIDWDNTYSPPPVVGKCDKCYGDKVITCTLCDGKGYTVTYESVPNYSGSGTPSRQVEVHTTCTKCHGNRVIECPRCHGTGEKTY